MYFVIAYLKVANAMSNMTPLVINSKITEWTLKIYSKLNTHKPYMHFYQIGCPNSRELFELVCKVSLTWNPISHNYTRFDHLKSWNSTKIPKNYYGTHSSTKSISRNCWNHQKFNPSTKTWNIDQSQNWVKP